MLRLREGFTALVLEEAGDSFHSNVRNHLRGAVRDAMQEAGKWGSYVDHTGDGQSGDCVYECESQHMRAPYEIQDLAGKTSAKIDTSSAAKVTPIVHYGAMAEPDDYYTTMQESFCNLKLYSTLPLYERYISKAERDKADDSSFAGKGKSFPILKPADVSAAVHAMGRAGSGNHSQATIKANIIRIAKAKGWEDELPKAWTATKASEAAARADVSHETLSLVESDGCSFLADIPLQEGARSSYPIKIISPGTGSTAHYPADVLKRDGPKVFRRGTLMFWNHQTARESSERPEGDLDKLAAITTSDAKYLDDGPKGPGLYAEAKVMADYGQKVEERAPHIGLSIRAGGSGDGTKIDGKPVLKSIDYVESVDYVTRAGRGGLALAEAARDAGILPEEGEDMTLKEAQDIAEAAVKKANAPLLLDLARRDGREEGIRVLESVSLPDIAKRRIIDRAVVAIEAENSPLVKDGRLQTEKFRDVVVAEAKAEGKYLAQITGAGRVAGLGSAAPFEEPLTEADIDEQEKQAKRDRKRHKALHESNVTTFSRLMGGNRHAAELAATKERVA